MSKINCWEFKKCGREQNGIKVNGLGICPVAINEKVNGIHEGKNGGRCCWIISGTFCKGEVQGEFAKKYKTCKDCDFYLKVREEEGGKFISSAVLLSKLQ